MDDILSQAEIDALMAGLDTEMPASEQLIRDRIKRLRRLAVAWESNNSDLDAWNQEVIAAGEDCRNHQDLLG